MDRKIKMGLIGCGEFGASNHIRALAQSETVELLAVCDVLESAAKKAAEAYKIKDYYTDYKELLKRDDIEAVAVVTPDQLHCEISCAAMRAGKHVLCEKPMALSIEDCRKMVEVQKETGMKLMIGQSSRLTPGFKEAKRLVDAGVIGELFFVESEYTHDYTNVSGMTTWRADPLRHVVLGGACHAVDLLRWIAGNPYETTAYSNKKMITSLPTDDCTIAILKFPNNVIGKLFVSSGNKSPYSMASRFYGTKGTIVVNNTDPFITVHRAKINEGMTILDGAYERPYENDVHVRYPIAVDNHNISEEHKLFIDSLLNSTPVPTGPEEGMATVIACRAIIQAADENRTVKIEY